MPLEYPEQLYRPSAKVVLVMRLDNFLDSDVLKGQAPAIQAKDLKGVKIDRAPLKVQENPAGPGFLIVGSAGVVDPKTAGAGYSTKSSDGHTFELAGIIPHRADHHQNGIRIADTLSLDIRWMDLPFDPRVIRSCAVLYYLGVIPTEHFARAVRGETREPKAGSATGDPLNLVPESFVDVYGNVRSNLRFQGWVDTWEMSLENDSQPLVKLECCDNTRLLIDQQHPAGLQFDVQKPIDEAVAALLANFPQMEGFTVEYRPTTVRNAKVPPRLSQVLSGTAVVPGLGAPAAKGGGSAHGEHMSVWDHLTDICSAMGHNIRVEGTTIIIQRATALYRGKAKPRTDDPYRTRQLPSGDYPVRAMVFGRNLLGLSIKHEYTRKKAHNVEVRSYLPRRKTTIMGRFPEKGDRIVHAVPGDGSDQKWTVYKVSGVADEKRLKKMAEDIYNNIGRNELVVKMKTKNLASFGGGAQDPDLLDLRAGDSVEVLLNREPGSSSITEMESKLSAQASNADRLKKLGFPDELANNYAQAYANAGFQRIYRVRDAVVSWDADEGVAVDLTCINYIETRLEKQPSDLASDPDEDPTAPK